MKRVLIVTTASVTLAAIAGAQPGPDEPAATAGSGSDAGSGSALGSGSAMPANPYVDEPSAPTPPAKPPRPRDPRINMPELLTTPTGWLLPAAVLYSRTALDTGGGLSSDNRVGLGDVAEFGIATTDQVRARTIPGAASEQVEPYFTATFRMGVAESRLFPQQPGLVLGFVKSFERNHDGFTTRIAQLTVVESKHIGARTAIHLGAAFWDASLQGGTTDTSLHDRTTHTIGDQIRGFGGIEVHPLPKSEILIDLGWSPEFCYGCVGRDQIRLRPLLSWGVRYEVADWMHLESGVRVSDIGDANLLDAQIFGQVTFTSWALRHAVDDLK
jgi:hypothetical protein